MSAPAWSVRQRLRTFSPLPLRALALVGGAVLAISTVAFFRVSLLPEIGATLGTTAATLSLVTTAFAVGRLLTDLPAGRLADVLAPGRALAFAGAGMSAGSLLFALAGSLGMVRVRLFWRDVHAGRGMVLSA